MNGSMIGFVAAALLFVIVALLMSKVKLEFSFRMKNLSECTLNIHVKAVYGLIRIKRCLDIKELISQQVNDDETPRTIHKWQEKLKDAPTSSVIKEMKHPVLEAIKKLDILCFIWRSCAGLGDAALTGRLAGAAWSIKGVIEAWLKRYVPMKKDPEITFFPLFNSIGFESELSCMLSIRTGKAILTMFRLYKNWKKLNNRRIENNGTSNQGFNDDSDGEFERNDRREYNRWRSG
ncbi:DUF2953 domain-containing protein [Siminovitchia acidinfaciens]|nr:DUF2953 domain-containing protein [Siminovitchia acidinfaciens]